MNAHVQSIEAARLLGGAPDHPDAALLLLGRQLECAFHLVDEIEGAPSDARMDAATEATAAIVDSISTVPARTLDGLRVKARAFLWYKGGAGLPGIVKALAGADDDTTCDRVFLSLMRDLMADRRQPAG